MDIYNLTPKEFIKKSKDFFLSKNWHLDINIYDYNKKEHKKYDQISQTKHRTYMTIILNNKKYAIDCNLSYSIFKNILYKLDLEEQGYDTTFFN